MGYFRKNRDQLQRMKAALEKKLRRLGDPKTKLDRERWFRLRSMIRGIERDLIQPELPL